MKILFGAVSHQLDAKNRIRIPSKFRNAFPENEPLYFAMYNGNRIAVMPESVLSERYNFIDKLTPADQNEMNAATSIFEWIEPVEEDSYGRAVIPPRFKKRAGIEKEVLTVGMRNFIEIWSQEVHDRVINSLTPEDTKAVYTKSHPDKA